MRIVYLFTFALLASCSQGAKETQVEQTTEAVETNQTSENYFGEQIDKSNIQSTSQLVSNLGDIGEVEAKIEGEIVKTCAKKGCWMTVTTDAGEEMRVTFKDYGFFVPKEGVEGKKTIMQGTLKKVVTDLETLKHFAEDAGKSQEEIDAITEPKEELTFVATGVIIEG